VEDVLDSSIAYDGDRALRMGAQGTTHVSQAGQVVHVPQGIKTLDFSIRVRVVTAEPEDAPGADDELWLELWNASTYQKIEEHFVAAHYNQFSSIGLHDFFANYWRAKVSLSPGKYAGKNVIVLLKVKENAAAATSFYLDNASLRYTSFGLVGN
jgi:hypothetical protein